LDIGAFPLVGAPVLHDIASEHNELAATLRVCPNISAAAWRKVMLRNYNASDAPRGGVQSILEQNS
jgi:hypothetical protein